MTTPSDSKCPKCGFQGRWAGSHECRTTPKSSEPTANMKCECGEWTQNHDDTKCPKRYPTALVRSCPKCGTIGSDNNPNCHFCSSGTPIEECFDPENQPLKCQVFNLAPPQVSETKCPFGKCDGTGTIYERYGDTEYDMQPCECNVPTSEKTGGPYTIEERRKGPNCMWFAVTGLGEESSEMLYTEAAYLRNEKTRSYAQGLSTHAAEVKELKASNRSIRDAFSELAKRFKESDARVKELTEKLTDMVLFLMIFKNQMEGNEFVATVWYLDAIKRRLDALSKIGAHK